MNYKRLFVVLIVVPVLSYLVAYWIFNELGLSFYPIFGVVVALSLATERIINRYQAETVEVVRGSDGGGGGGGGAAL